MPASTSTQPLSADQHAAYRRLALTIIGADIQTLLTQLRERNDLTSTYIRLTPPETRAA
jgi:hypothetical protein